MEAYITLVATDSYAPGGMTLACRLRDLNVSRYIVCFVTPNVTLPVRSRLQDCFDKVIPVDTLYTNTPDNLKLLGRPELDITFTKLEIWRLTQFSKLVFLDADTFPLRNIDELFDRPCFSAAPDVGWPDCFNSGVFVTVPSETTYHGLRSMAEQRGSFDGGDQGLLNSYFNTWSTSSANRLPFIYNTTPSAAYSYIPAFLEYRKDIAVVHFIGRDKPWHWQRFSDGSVFPRAGHHAEMQNLVQLWWDTWDKHFGKVTPNSILNHDPQQRSTMPVSRMALAQQTSVPRSVILHNPAPKYTWNIDKMVIPPEKINRLQNSRRLSSTETMVKPVPTLTMAATTTTTSKATPTVMTIKTGETTAETTAETITETTVTDMKVTTESNSAATELVAFSTESKPQTATENVTTETVTTTMTTPTLNRPHVHQHSLIIPTYSFPNNPPKKTVRASKDTWSIMTRDIDPFRKYQQQSADISVDVRQQEPAKNIHQSWATAKKNRMRSSSFGSSTSTNSKDRRTLQSPSKSVSNEALFQWKSESASWKLERPDIDLTPKNSGQMTPFEQVAKESRLKLVALVKNSQNIKLT